jgi:hypothetical protein
MKWSPIAESLRNTGLEQWYSTGGTRRHLTGYVDYTICVTCIMYQLWGYKVEEILYLGVREQKRMNTTGLEQWYSTGGTRRHLTGYVYYTICVTCIMYQQLWGYKVEETLYLGVREQKRLNTTGLEDRRVRFQSFMTERTQMTALWNTVPCSLVETDEVSDVLTASAMSSMS